MKKLFNIQKVLLFMLLACFAGGLSPAWADATTANFDDGLPDGWSLVGSLTNDDTRYRSGKGIWTDDKSTTDNYVITQVVDGTFEFYARAYNKSYASTVVVYEYTGTGLGTLLYTTGSMYTSSTPTWSKYTFTVEEASQLAIVLNYAAIDDVTYTPGTIATCAKPKTLTITNITDESAVLGWTSGADTWNLQYKAEGDADYTAVNGITDNPYTLTGLDAGANYTFQVQAVCSSTETSDWSSAGSFTTLLCNASAQRNISYSLTDSYGDGWNGNAIRIVDDASGVEVANLTISSGSSASGTVALCPNRTYNIVWVSGNYGYECSFTLTGVDDEEIITHAADTAPSAGTLTTYSWDNTPVGDGAQFAIDLNSYDFGIKNVNGVSQQAFTITNSGNAPLTVTTTDATDFTVEKIIRFSETRQWSDVYLYTWAGEGDAKVEQLGAWPGEKQTNYLGQNEYNQGIYAISIPAGTEKLILHNYNGDQSNNIIMDFTKTGLYLDSDKNGVFFAAAEEGIIVPAKSGDTDGSFTFKVQMNTATAGVKSGNIELAFDAVNATSFTIPVSGTVLPEGAEVVDFNTAIPERWVNGGWTISNGAASSGSGKTLTTQKLDFSSEASPFFIMKVKSSSSYASGDQITIEGSADNGLTWTAFDAIVKSYDNGDFGNSSADYSTIVLSIPNTVDKLRFTGKYVLVDEIIGLKYSDNDPVMGIYTDADCTVAAATSVTKEFGFVTADPAPATYYIKNDGTGTMTLTKGADPAGLTVTLDRTSVPAGDHATLTIAMPVADNGGYHSGNVVVTAEGLGTFTVAVSGVVVEDGKLNLNFASDAIPSTWTASNWSKDTECITTGYSTSASLTTSTLTAVAGEQLVVVAKNTYTSSSYTVGVKYKKAGTEDEFADLIPAANVGTSYTMLAGTIEEAGDYLLQINGGYAQIQRIYGLSKPNAPEMVVYDGEAVAAASHNFGKVTDENDATWTLTVKNDGLATLTGLTATLGGDNAAHYTVAITGATGDNNDEIAVGASATVTVTQLKDNLGTHSATLTISATSLDSKVIALSGETIDHTILDIDFDTSSAWPAEILEHNGWSIYNYNNYGYVYNSTSTSASLILTPLTVANLTDKLTFRAKYYSSSARDLTVRYTTDGGITWNEYECSEEDPKTSFKSQITSSYKDFEVTNIPAGTVAFDFYGKSIYLDDFAGDMKVTSAPLMAFNTVSDNISGANLSADGVATYTLANKGNADYVGTVAATNVKVGVTGEDVTFESNTLTIPVGKTATITATMAFAAPYGEKTGSLAITSESWVGDINVNYTATLVDPTDFVEDFAGNAKPAGWYSESWTYSDGNAHVYAGVAKPMITEKIGAEAGKNTMTFDAKVYSGTDNQTLNVYTSTDRKTWGAAQTFTLTSTEQPFSLTALADGEYYVKFEAANAAIDNIAGVKKLDAPAHDLYEVSTTMAATGIPGASYTATVVGVSLRADETVTAELWVKKGTTGTMVAEQTNQTMTVNTNKTFTLTGNLPTEEGEYKMWVTVKNSLNDDDYAYFNTDEIDFTLTHTHTMAITTFPNAAAVQADDNNQYTGTFFVTVQNTGSAAIAANDVSVSLIDNADAEHVITTAWTAESSDVLYMNTKKDDQDIASGENCVLKAWCWNTAEDGEWITFTNVNDGFWSLNLNGKTNFKIVRYNSAGADENPWNNVWNQSDNLALASGNLVKFNGYDNGGLTFISESMAYLDPTMTTTLKVTVSGTLTNGENANLAFKAKENLGNTYYGNGLTSSVSVTAAPVIVLDEETALTEVATGQNRKVTLAHKFVEGWNTICVPFAISNLSVFGDGAVAYSFDGYDTTTKELTFNKVDFENSGELEAGKPYVIYVPAAINSALTFTGITFADANPTAGESTSNGLTFQGTYAPVSFSEIIGDQWGLTAAGKIAKASATATMKGFRGYFTGVDLSNARMVFLGDESTGIRTITVDGNVVEGTYNLQGQKVETLKQGGLYIINGKKVVVK